MAPAGIDDLSAHIDRGPDLVDAGLALRIDAGFDDLGDVTQMAVAEGEAHAGALRQRLATPTGLFGDQLEYAEHATGIERGKLPRPGRGGEANTRRGP